jgi:hypothetical protein
MHCTNAVGDSRLSDTPHNHNAQHNVCMCNFIPSAAIVPALWLSADSTYKFNDLKLLLNHGEAKPTYSSCHAYLYQVHRVLQFDTTLGGPVQFLHFHNGLRYRAW